MKKKQLFVGGGIVIGVVLVVSLVLSQTGKINSSVSMFTGEVILAEETLDIGGWSLYTLSHTQVTNETGEADRIPTIKIDQLGTSEDDIQLIFNEPYNLVNGKYELNLSLNCSTDRQIRIKLEQDNEDATSLFDEVLELKKGDNNIIIPFDVNDERAFAALSIHLGYFSQKKSLSSHTLTVKESKIEQIGEIDISTAMENQNSQLDVNMLDNHDFSSGSDSWGIYNMARGEGELSEEEGVAKVHIKDSGTETYAVQFYQDGIALYTGNKYKLSFKYKGDREYISEVRIQKNGGDYGAYVNDTNLSFTTEWQTYETEFVMEAESDIASRFQFNLGTNRGDSTGDLNLYFDDFNLQLLEGIVEGPEMPNSIKVNQVGYRPEDTKVAFVTSNARTYKLYNEANQIVLTGNLILETKDENGEAIIDSHSGDIVRSADYSQISCSGNYFIEAGGETSETFTIDEDVYSSLANAVLGFYYYQRCGGDGVDAAYVGEAFAHAPCHMGTAVYYRPTDAIYGDVEADVSGGWHDAGDYGRYVTPAAKAVADLLLTLEHYPRMGELDLGSPNLLEETRYEIEWLLKMQNPETGGVYHKVTTAKHAGMAVLPENDEEQLYLCKVSPQAAGDFAAVMAYAYRMYKDVDLEFSNTCLDASILAWEWLEANPDTTNYVDPSFFHTGGYPDSSAKDERYWAATELYKTTGEEKYLDYIHNNDLPKAGFGWADMGSYALLTYLTTDGVNKKEDIYKEMKNRFIEDANQIIDTWENDGYKVGLDNYVWGSNKDLADKTMLLIIANRLAPRDEYEAAIMDHFDYLLGRNALGISYVTDLGEKSAMHPHHRQCIITGQVIPGMLVGGPNEEIATILGDPVASMVESDTPPAKCYADIEGSFATNEITIYWNSPLAYILGYLNEE